MVQKKLEKRQPVASDPMVVYPSTSTPTNIVVTQDFFIMNVEASNPPTVQLSVQEKKTERGVA